MRKLAWPFAVVFAAGAVVGTWLQDGRQRIAWQPALHAQPEASYSPDYTMFQPFQSIGSAEPERVEKVVVGNRHKRQKSEHTCCDEKDRGSDKKREDKKRGMDRKKKSLVVKADNKSNSRRSSRQSRNSKERS